jgi:type I restriction enzyme S subunit
MMPDLIFRAVFRDESKIDPRYLAEVMRMPHLRHQIEAVATGTSPTMKKISKPGLLALRLPLPPIAIQKKLVAEVTAARERIAAERAAAAKLSADTAREVEEMILGHRRIYGKDER